MVDTDELINSAIEARAALGQKRAALAFQRDQVVQQLAQTGGRRGGANRASLQAKLFNLNVAEREINAQERDIERTRDLRVHSALRNHAMATKETEDALHTQVADQAANIHRGMLQLQAKYPNRFSDSDQAAKFHDEMVQLTDANRYGMRNSKTASEVLKASQFHDQEVEKTRNRLAARLFKETGLSPDQFASGIDTARATNVPLIDPTTKTPPSKDEIEKKRADNGTTVAMDVNGVTVLFQRGLFDNLKQTFGTRPQPQAVAVPTESTYVPPTTVTGERQLPSGLKETTFASGGTAIAADKTQSEGAEMIENAKAQGAARQQYLEQNPRALIPGSGVVGADATRVADLPANLAPGANIPVPAAATRPSTLVQPYQAEASPATLPTGVQPNAPIQPVQQIAAAPSTQPIPAAPAPQTRNVGGVTYAWNGTRWEPQ